jgi:hypothetical protein
MSLVIGVKSCLKLAFYLNCRNEISNTSYGKIGFIRNS